jgi:hypothetical protein
MKRLLRRIGLQPRVEEAQVVPMRGVSLLEESYAVQLGSEQAATITQPGAWTLETDALGPALSRFAQETRVVATDQEARARFRRYWRWARFGIIAIRLLLPPEVRRAADKRWLDELQRG